MKIFWMQQCAGLIVAGAVAGLLSGCSRTHDHDPAAGDAHAHPEEPHMAQITAFGERHEVFAEHEIPAAGVPARFVTHVTDLATREPRREGSVRFLLRLGEGTPIEHVEKGPSRPGIYEAKLTFPKPGSWSVALEVPSGDGDKRVVLPPVTVYADAHATLHAEVPATPEGITFLKEQQWKVRVGTEPVSARQLVEQLRVPAVVSARPGGLAQVTSPAAGRLALPAGKSMPVVGDRVEAGQVLALIEPSFSEAGARMAEAAGEATRSRLAVEQAELALRRVEKLATAEAKSGRELEEARFELKQAQARHAAALAAQALYRQAGDAPLPVIELRSPIAGVLTAFSGAAVGEHVPAERNLFTVLDSATVFIEARIPEVAAHRLVATRAAHYEMPGDPGRRVTITGAGGGRLVFSGVQVDPASRTLPLVYEAVNPAGALRVGQSLMLQVETGRVQEALAIPDGAIVEEGGRPVAFVQLGGETFDKRDLVLGIRDGGWVQVVSGLAPGERVVTHGAYAVKLASVSTAIPAHGHAH